MSQELEEGWNEEVKPEGGTATNHLYLKYCAANLTPYKKLNMKKEML